MRTRHVLVIVAPAAALVLATGCSSTGRSAPPPAASQVTLPPATLAAAGGAGTITATGVGTVNGTPDTLTVSIDVSVHAAHAGDALHQDNATTASVQRVLERDGVAAPDIQTGWVSLQQNSSAGGYEADEQLNATVHNLAGAGTLINDAVAAAGDAGRLDGVSFSLSDSSPLMATARKQAVANATIEAQQLAAAAGRPLGALRSITDQPQASYAPMPFATSGSASAAPVPINPGQQQLSVEVQTVWALG